MAESPSALDCQHFLAGAHMNLGLLLEWQGGSAEAEQEYRQAVTLAEKLATDAPSATEYQRQLATGSHMLADLLQTAERPVEAERRYGRAIATPRKTDGSRVPERAGMDSEHRSRSPASRPSTGASAREEGGGREASNRGILEHVGNCPLPRRRLEGCHRGVGEIDAASR